MKQIGEAIKERNLQLDTSDPIARDGFTQIPNFIIRSPAISAGAKVTYSLFLSYAWHNDSCFPGQDRLAEDMGMSRVRVTQLIAELERMGLISIQRRGQGKTNLYTIHFKVKSHVDSQIIVMLDEDKAGQNAREEIAGRLAKFAFVKVHVFDKPEMQPENLSADDVRHFLPERR